MGLFGLAVFAGAMWWDRSDVARATQRADIAFWLHLLASFLLIPLAFDLLPDGPAAVAIALAGLVALVLLALAIDRRAPLAVALPFALSTVPGDYALLGGLALIGGLLALALQWEKVRGWGFARLNLAA